MSDHIDHAATAADIARNVPIQRDSEGTVSEWIALGQLEATLALVEQQRIANLIAWHGGEFNMSRSLRAEIRKGLGL